MNSTFTARLSRTCGSCSACCQVFSIEDPALKKSQGRPCPHARCASTGCCTIHASRPSTCRSYVCAWLEGLGEDHHRPDRLGLVIDAMFLPDAGPFFKVTEVTRHALRQGRAPMVIENLARLDPVVVISDGQWVRTVGEPGRVKVVQAAYVAAVMAATTA